MLILCFQIRKTLKSIWFDLCIFYTPKMTDARRKENIYKASPSFFFSFGDVLWTRRITWLTGQLALSLLQDITFLVEPRASASGWLITNSKAEISCELAFFSSFWLRLWQVVIRIIFLFIPLILACYIVSLIKWCRTVINSYPINVKCWMYRYSRSQITN